MIRTYIIGDCDACGKRDVDVVEERDSAGDYLYNICRECLGIEPPEELFDGPHQWQEESRKGGKP